MPNSRGTRTTNWEFPQVKGGKLPGPKVQGATGPLPPQSVDAAIERLTTLRKLKERTKPSAGTETVVLRGVRTEQPKRPVKRVDIEPTADVDYLIQQLGRQPSQLTPGWDRIVQAIETPRKYRVVARVDGCEFTVDTTTTQPLDATLAAYERALVGINRHPHTRIGQWLRAIGIGADHVSIDWERC